MVGKTSAISAPLRGIFSNAWKFFYSWRLCGQKGFHPPSLKAMARQEGWERRKDRGPHRAETKKEEPIKRLENTSIRRKDRGGKNERRQKQ